MKNALPSSFNFQVMLLNYLSPLSNVQEHKGLINFRWGTQEKNAYAMGKIGEIGPDLTLRMLPAYYWPKRSPVLHQTKYLMYLIFQRKGILSKLKTEALALMQLVLQLSVVLFQRYHR